MKKYITLPNILVVIIIIAVWMIVLFKEPEIEYRLRIEEVEVIIPLEEIDTATLVNELIIRDDIASLRTHANKGARVLTFEEDFLVTGNNVILVYKEED